jgi:plastocyanin
VSTTQQLRFEPGEFGVEPGESITFVIENPSAILHTFTIAISTEKRDILLDVTLEANATERATVTFPATDARLYLFCRPHELAAMVGAILVGDAPPAAVASEPRPLEVATPQPSSTSPSTVTSSPAVTPTVGQDGVQRISMMESIYPAYFRPDRITVKRGIPVELLISTEQSEHVNRISVLPWVESSDVVFPGRPVTIRFTPDDVGEFKVRNIGHGFEATMVVTE